MPSREAARRQAVDTLRLASSIAAYAAGRISADGLGPGEARQAAAYAASELEEAAGALRRLARPNPVAPVADSAARQDEAARRRAVALELAASGWSARAIAGRLGVNPATARRYLRSR